MRHVTAIPARLLVLAALAIMASGAQAQLAVSITVAPPALPVYEQPPIPAPGYIWTPGYWSYGPYGYFWVPGTWVEPPQIGLLWTPGYWAWSAGVFVWNPGYWAPQIGFYGGVNYGYGYPGRGYEGAYWRDDHLYYNRTVNNISNVEIRNVYSRTVINNVNVSNVSYVGGPDGIAAQPTAQEREVARARHERATPQQILQRTSAAARPELRAAENHGRPAVAATARPGNFTEHVVGAHGAEHAHRAAAGSAEARAPVNTPLHARDLPRPPAFRPPAASASEQERAVGQQRAELQARQEREREALAQQQERDHARLSQQQHGNREALAAMERQHQQQTQQLQRQHATEQQRAQAHVEQAHAAQSAKNERTPTEHRPQQH